MAPENSRTTTSTHSAVAAAVTKKLSASAQNPSSSTGRRPCRSDSAPSTGDATKFARLNANVMRPNQNVWSAPEPVKRPTIAGSTGTMGPIDTMSIRTVAMMNGMAAPRAASLRTVVRCFLGDLHVVDVALAHARGADLHELGLLVQLG